MSFVRAYARLGLVVLAICGWPVACLLSLSGYITVSALLTLAVVGACMTLVLEPRHA